MGRTVKGTSFTWEISDTPIGSGDAGEVYSAMCVDNPDITGILKKPAHIATGGTIQRQASQIAREAQVLAKLDGLPHGKAHPPRLLDQAPDYTEGTANFFFISETAPGRDMATIQAELRKADKPFPRRIIITMLDALFDLFSQAHAAGILWNDVKLEHIYWHNASGDVGVIDWGNALFLDNFIDSQVQNPPRWEDYQQMIDSLGIFLEQNAPDLFTDLGWEEFQDQELDRQQISILARRIAYQQQVVSLNVMEYQSLIRVIVEAEPSLAGLQQIKEYQNKLEMIGAPWFEQDVLRYCLDLVLKSLAEGDRVTVVKATASAWDLFRESLDLTWHLLREYCRHPDILRHSAFPALVKHTFAESWADAIWEAIAIARDSDNHPWWDRIIPVMRQKALEISDPPPRSICQSMLNWHITHGGDEPTRIGLLNASLENWRNVGEQSQESPFEYVLLDLIREENTLPEALRLSVKRSFSPGEAFIRELYQAWNLRSWDSIYETIRKIACWDPDRWGLHNLAEELNKFESWLNHLYIGPRKDDEVGDFIQDSLANRPTPDRLIGSPLWLNKLLMMLAEILQNKPIAHYESDVEQWCPWLLPYSDLATAEGQADIIESDNSDEILAHFVGHLKSWSDIDAGINFVKENAPQFHPYCQRLADGFHKLLSLNVALEEIKSLSDENPHPAFDISCDILDRLNIWRRKLAEGDLYAAQQTLGEENKTEWVLVNQAVRETACWNSEIIPALAEIGDCAPSTNLKLTDPLASELSQILADCEDLQSLWQKIYQGGIHNQLLEEIERVIENARKGFITWQVAQEHSDHRIRLILYHQHLPAIRDISALMVKLSQHSRQARVSFAMLEDKADILHTHQIYYAANVLDHLSAIESLLVHDPQDWQCPDWIESLNKILNATDTESRREVVLSLPQNHPFYTRLVKSTFV